MVFMANVSKLKKKATDWDRLSMEKHEREYVIQKARGLLKKCRERAQEVGNHGFTEAEANEMTIGVSVRELKRLCEYIVKTSKFVEMSKKKVK